LYERLDLPPLDGIRPETEEAAPSAHQLEANSPGWVP